MFDENPIVLTNENGTESLLIEHPENVQLHHVEAMKEQLLGNGTHPSGGKTALHTSWIMDKIMNTK